MISSSEHVHHHSLAVEVLARARRAQLAGGTVMRGREGQGASRTLHRQHLFVDDAPLAIVIIDEPGRIAAFLEQQHDLLRDVFVILDDVTAFRS